MFKTFNKSFNNIKVTTMTMKMRSTMIGLYCISFTLFVHSLHITSLVPINFTTIASSSSSSSSIDDQWLNNSIECPLKCKCVLNPLNSFGDDSHSHSLIQHSITSSSDDNILLSSVRTVNCSSQSLQIIPKTIPKQTQYLILSDNQLESLYERFTHLNELLELNLSMNHINYLGRGHIFNNLTHLQVLDISHNTFKTMYSGVFRGLRRLEKLVINDGQLKYLDEHTFDGLEQLQQLYLKNNRLSSIYLELFQSISNLRILDLEGNLISYLSGGIFTSLTTLRVLSLKRNTISTINDNAFVGLDQLEELNLSDNRLVRVPSIAFQSLKRIESIVCDFNRFEQLLTGDFVHSSVQTLSIQNCNQLTLVDRGAFWDLPHLRTLLLNHNQNLQFIDCQAFLSLSSLQSLQLMNCNLNTIQTQLINNLIHRNNRNQITISFEGNQIQCNDCNIKSLFHCVTNSDNNCSLYFENSDQIMCETITHQTKQLISLNESEIPSECEPKLILVSNSLKQLNQTIHKKIGDKHLFQCRALGIPTPKIHWILPDGHVLNETTNSVHFQFKPTGSLRLFYLKPKDSGIYRCIADNEFGQQYADIHLLVDNIDLHLFAISVSNTYVTLVWNGTGRNAFHEYMIVCTQLNDNNNQNATIHDNEHNSDDEVVSRVSVNHFLRSYTFTHLKPKTKYKMCLTVKDDTIKDNLIELSCTTVTTKSSQYMTFRSSEDMQSTTGSNNNNNSNSDHKSNVAIALALTALLFMLFALYFSLIAAKKHRIQREYEIPHKNNTANSDHMTAAVRHSMITTRSSGDNHTRQNESSMTSSQRQPMLSLQPIIDNIYSPLILANHCQRAYD